MTEKLKLYLLYGNRVVKVRYYHFRNKIIRFFRRFSILCYKCHGKGAVWYTSKDIRKKYGKLCDYNRCPYC